jgi:asparagine synthase (glutamine-hydrolysing)
MCGITGILYFDRRQPSCNLLERMTDIMHHRGPDDTGYFIEEGIGLGFKRLSIIDLNEGHQPLSNEDESLWVVFNGEIYNYKFLRSHLQEKGHRFKTETDTEILVHLFEEYGTDCVQHLRGMFAFVIWNKKNRELFCARDFFGIKPFYYYSDHEQFIFGSEIKSVIATNALKKVVNPESLLNYLTFQYVPDPNTMFQHIHKLPPAHYLHINSDGKMNLKKYWDPMFEPEDRPINDYIDELRFKLEDSVKHHMQSDVKRGCFLSSGIDSTSIAAHMRKIEPIKTFSVGFDGPHNECVIAKQTADELIPNITNI